MDEILINNVVEIQRKLTSLIGVSGRENQVREFIYSELKNFADNVWIDALGNVLGERKGTKVDGLRIMLDAHMDEIGLIMRYIEPNGFLRFTPIGGIDKRLYPGSRVSILSDQNKKISGIIGMPPPHITKPADREVCPDHYNLFIDIGAANKEEVIKLGIDIGSMGVLDSNFEYLEEKGILRGRAFDDRTGCNVILQLAKLLSQLKRPENTILYCFSIAEEVGARGVRPASYKLKPDIGIAIENTIAADVPDVSPDKCPTQCLLGPAISIADNSTIYDERLLKIIKNIAIDLSIPWQYKLPTFGGTNAGGFHLIRGGIPAAGISVPCRYIHSPIAQLFVSDIVKTIQLLLEVLINPINLQY